MKKLVVSRECTACGLCFGCFDFLKEGNDGKAVVENNGILPANVTMNKLQEVINNCPVNALKVENFEYVKSSGTKGVKELLGIMRKPLDYKLPSADFYKFNNVEIPIPYSPNEHRYIYKSYDSAVSAGFYYVEVDSNNPNVQYFNNISITGGTGTFAQYAFVTSV